MCLKNSDWIEEIESKFGVVVGDYVVKTESISCNCEWRSVDDMILNPKNLQRVKDILSNRKIILSTEEDVILWCASKTGNYSVKLGYEA